MKHVLELVDTGEFIHDNNMLQQLDWNILSLLGINNPMVDPKTMDYDDRNKVYATDSIIRAFKAALIYYHTGKRPEHNATWSDTEIMLVDCFYQLIRHDGSR